MTENKYGKFNLLCFLFGHKWEIISDVEYKYGYEYEVKEAICKRCGDFRELAE